MISSSSINAYDLIMDQWKRINEAPTDPVSFSNHFFPINPKADRPDFGPDLPPMLENWLLFATGYLDANKDGTEYWEHEGDPDDNRDGGIVGPPGFGKTLISERLVLWMICNNRDSIGVYATKTGPKAWEFTKTIKQRLEDKTLNEAYGPLPDKRDWSGTHFSVIRPSVSKDPTFQAACLFGQLEAARINYAIIDDIVDKGSIRSKAERRHAVEWLTATLLPRLDPGGFIFFIGSRWHPQDIYAVLKNMPRFKGRVIQVKAEPEPGISLDDTIFPTKDLMQRKGDIGSTMFNLRYNGMSADSNVQIFPEVVRRRREYMLDKRIVLRAGCIDFNASEKESSDLTALTFGSLLVGGEIVFDSCYTGHMKRDYLEFINKSLRQSIRHDLPVPKIIWAESVNFQYALGQTLMGNLEFGVQLIPLKDTLVHRKGDLDYYTVSKYERIKMILQGPIETGRASIIDIPDNQPRGVSDLLSDFELYPEVDFDDPLDSAQMLYHMLSNWVRKKGTGRRASAGY